MIFWVCLGLLAYHYVGYPLLLFVFCALSKATSDFWYLIRRRNRRCLPQTDYVPQVALLMSIYNEEAVIRAKVKNTLAIDYPSDRLDFLLGLDAPTDSTGGVLSQIQLNRLRVFPFQTRRGKLAVLCDLAAHTSAEILVFTDANTMLEKNCVRNLVRHFADGRVGVVSGEEIRVVTPGTDPAGESLYWRYESALKILESRLDCSLGGNGAALAIRRSLFRPRKQSIVEDFQIPLEIRFKGYRVVYDPEAVAVEEIAPTFFSHRVLRWFAPALLLGAFFCSILLATQLEYAVLLAAQSAFYLAAGLGYWLKKSGKPARLLSMPLSFCSMNFALLLGFVRYLNGRQTLTWKPTLRQIPPEMLLDKGQTIGEIAQRGSP